MASKTYKFSGHAFWPMVYEGNHDSYGGKDFYKITVELDDESWAEFSKSGLKLRPKQISEEGVGECITFRRDLVGKSVKNNRGKTNILGGGAPRVVDADGEPMTGDQLIGNGSRVEVLVEVYDTRMGKGHRLEAVRVVDLVKYEPNDNYDDDDDGGEQESPAPKTPASKKKLPF